MEKCTESLTATHNQWKREWKCLTLKHNKDYPLFGTTSWMQKGFSTLKSGFQGLLLCILTNGTEWICMVPTWTVLPKLTRRQLPTEKVISNSHLQQRGPQVPLQWSQGSSQVTAFPRRNLRKKPSLTSTDLVFLHDSFV